MKNEINIEPGKDFRIDAQIHQGFASFLFFAEKILKANACYAETGNSTMNFAPAGLFGTAFIFP